MDPVELLNSASKLTNRGPVRRLIPSAAVSILSLLLLAITRNGTSRPNLDFLAGSVSNLTFPGALLLVLVVAITSIFLAPYFGLFSRVVGADRRVVSRAGRLRSWATQRQQRRIERYRAEKNLIEASRLPSHAIGGTALSNVLHAADEYARDRYALDAAVALPRLLRLVPEDVSTDLRDKREDIQFALDLSGALCLLSFVELVLLWRSGIWLVLPVLTLAMSWVSYRNAVTAAVIYAEAQRVVFDLHRSLLYPAMRMPLPINQETERVLGTLISEFFWSGGNLGAFTRPEVPSQE